MSIRSDVHWEVYDWMELKCGNCLPCFVNPQSNILVAVTRFYDGILTIFGSVILRYLVALFAQYPTCAIWYCGLIINGGFREIWEFRQWNNPHKLRRHRMNTIDCILWVEGENRILFGIPSTMKIFKMIVFLKHHFFM